MKAIENAPLLVGVIKYMKIFMKDIEAVEFMDKLYIKKANDGGKIVIDYENNYKEYLKDIKFIKYKIKRLDKIGVTIKNHIKLIESFDLLDNEKNKTSFYLDLENNEPELTEEYEGTILREDLDDPKIEKKLKNIKEKMAAASLIYEIMLGIKPEGLINIEITQEYTTDSSLLNIREIFKLDFFRFYVLIDITEEYKINNPILNIKKFFKLENFNFYVLSDNIKDTEPFSAYLYINHINVKQKNFDIN